MIIDTTEVDITVDTEMMDAIHAPLPSSPPPKSTEKKEKEDCM